MPRRRKKRIVNNVTLTGFADKGKAVGRIEEGEEAGQVVFVERSVPGDVVNVVVTKKKDGYMMGYPSDFVKYSEDRIEPFCEHFGVCGGCKYQNLAYETQLKHKEEMVRDALQRIGKVEVGEFRSILPALDTAYYRNKLEFTFSNKRWLTENEIGTNADNTEGALGFHRPRAFDKIVDIKKCYLQKDPSNDIRNAVRKIAKEMDLSFYDVKKRTGFLRHLFVRTTSIGEVMIIVSFFYEDVEKRTELLEEIIRQFPSITSVHYVINSKANDFILDLDIVTYKGKGHIEELLGEVRYKIGPKSFFQTNTQQAIRLFDVVVDFAELTGEENVYDLYTGIGSIALYVANKCKQVVGIEEIEAAIDDAKINMEFNNIENAVFYAGDVKDMLDPDFAVKHGKPDLIITDPPRAGMHKKVAQMLLELAAPKMVYVSCNPATQARDLNILSEKYEVLKVQPVDMFPHTHHIENVALLKLR